MNKHNTTLSDVKAANPGWFSPQNKRFFGDVKYYVYRGYLIRSTYAWSDSFGQPKRLHYRVNPLSDTLKLRPLLEESFDTLKDAKAYIKGLEVPI